MRLGCYISDTQPSKLITTQWVKISFSPMPYISINDFIDIK